MQVFTLKQVSVGLSFIALLSIGNPTSAQRNVGRSGYYRPSPRGYVYAPRPVTRSSFNINIGFGNRYYARPYMPYYRSFVPYGRGIGFRVNVLPYGYLPIHFGNDYYYYYDNTFYRRYDDRNYEVVTPPIGAKLPQLPSAAKAVTIDGQKYYELGGTYYIATYNNNNQILYEVVGINGELRTHQNEIGNNQNLPINRPVQEGDFVDTLPDGYKTITINGQTLYLSPDDIYYEQIVEGNRTYYKVVGK